MTCTVENYEKGEVKELEDHVKMQCVQPNAIHMNVTAGSKIPNVMRYAERKMNVRLAYSLDSCYILCIKIIITGPKTVYNCTTL